MRPSFNTAGPCLPGEHDMLPPERRPGRVLELIDDRKYFTLHSGRQTGKTTCAFWLVEHLNASGRHRAAWVDLQTGPNCRGRGMTVTTRALHAGMVRAGLVVLLALALGCARHRVADGPPVARAFYFWRTTFALSAEETRALAELHVVRLYVRVFDVGWSEADHRAVPMGPIAVSPGTRPPVGIELVPVVFVRDEVLRHAAPAELAGQIWGEVQRRAAALGAVPRELQLDCDWTEHTREAYFALLRSLRAVSHVALSATIRLHQVKYRERTGVPPVERGMLMFYNMGKLGADPEARAIFDARSAERYLARVVDYPLPLDLALPIWSWTVQVRDGAVVGLLQSTDPAELGAAEFLERLGDGRYTATRTTFLHGALVREGDVLKAETTGPDETLVAARLIAPRLASSARTVSLFDLSERNLRRHDARSLERVFDTIH